MPDAGDRHDPLDPLPGGEGAPLSAGEQLVRLAAEAERAATPGAALRKLIALRRELDAFEREQVARVLSEGGTFASIGRDLGLSRQAVHRRYRALAPVQEAPPAATPAPDVPALQTSPQVRRAIRYALEEATALGAPALGDEHVLLGLLRAAPPRVLEDAGVTLAKARHRIEATSPNAPFFARRLSLADARAALAGPAREALGCGSLTIEPEHLLGAILRDPASRAVRTLRALGAEPDAIRAGLVEPRVA